MIPVDRPITGVRRSFERQRPQYTNYTNDYTNAARNRPRAPAHNREQDALHFL